MCTMYSQIWRNINVNKPHCLSSEMVPFQMFFFQNSCEILLKCINKPLWPNIQINCLTNSCTSSSSSPWKYFLNPKHCDTHFFLNPVQIGQSTSFNKGVVNHKQVQKWTVYIKQKNIQTSNILYTQHKHLFRKISTKIQYICKNEHF